MELVRYKAVSKQKFEFQKKGINITAKQFLEMKS